MNKRMNRYSLNVYQVVCLVIGLCCVWCSSGENSNEMELFGPSKDVALDIDSQVESVSAEITNAIDELKDLRDIQSIRIHLIRQGQPGLMKQQHYKGLKSIQSNPSCLDKLEDVFEQMEIEAISVLVKEELIWDSLNIAIQQMEEWLSEWKNTQMPEEESRVESICKLAIIARQIHQIKSDLRGLQNQFPNPKISRIEINLIAIGDQYHPIGLKARFVTIMVRELMKIRPNITISEWIHLEEIMESKIDQLLKNDELKSPDSISRLIEEALVWLDDTIKEMEVKSESERKQKPTSSEPSNSRTQSSNPQTNGSGMVKAALVQLNDRSKKMKVKSVSVSKRKPTDSEPSNSRTQSSNPQTNGSGMGGKLHSTSKSAGQDSTSSFNRHGLKLSKLVRRSCTIS